MLDFLKSENKDKLTDLDLGFIEDSINVIIDLLHLEIHSFKSFCQTREENWLSISNQARIERTELLELICDKEKLKTDGELWCVNKHSLRIVGGYIELGNREQTKGNKEKAIYYYDLASTWLGIFLIKNNIKGGEK